jgi:hypothetical protein
MCYTERVKTYTTLDGEVLDLGGLTSVEGAYFQACWEAYRDGERWVVFAERVTGEANPLVGPGRRVTRFVADHPLYRALRDLEDRLGVQQGELAAEPGDDVTTDPLEDEWLSVSDAASRQGVTFKAVYNAIERGDLIGSHERPARVSLNSLQRWSVSEGRQRAGRSARAKSA